MNGDLRIYPELGYVVVSLSNIDPPAASSIVEFFTRRGEWEALWASIWISLASVVLGAEAI